MSNTTITEMITHFRDFTGDSGELFFDAVPIGLIDGTNDRFRFDQAPLASGTLALMLDNAELAEGSDYSVNYDVGLVIMASGFVPAPTSSFTLHGKTLRRPDGQIRSILVQAIGSLFGVWDAETAVSGDDIGAELSDRQKLILSMSGNCLLLRAEMESASRSGIAYKDSSNSFSTVQRARDLANAVENCKKDLAGLGISPNLVLPVDRKITTQTE